MQQGVVSLVSEWENGQVARCVSWQFGPSASQSANGLSYLVAAAGCGSSLPTSKVPSNSLKKIVSLAMFSRAREASHCEKISPMSNFPVKDCVWVPHRRQVWRGCPLLSVGVRASCRKSQQNAAPLLQSSFLERWAASKTIPNKLPR